MKLSIFMGSPRSTGNTAMLLAPFLDECARLGAETERVELYQRVIQPCLGCMVCQDCMDGPGCVQRDDFDDLFHKMTNSDAVVLATPIYAWYCTPPMTALLDRATEPEYGPVIPVTTAMGLRALPFADIEYLECTHHVVHYHLASGEDVASLSLRVPFSEVAKPLLADARFLQPHRSYVVNLAAAAQLSSGELWMRSGARVPIPRGREPAVRAAFRAFLEG